MQHLLFLVRGFDLRRVLQQGHRISSVKKNFEHRVHHFCPVKYLKFPGREAAACLSLSVTDSFLRRSQIPVHTCVIINQISLCHFI